MKQAENTKITVLPARKGITKEQQCGKRRIYGVKVWSLQVADTRFSKWLRDLRGWKCERCCFQGNADGTPAEKMYMQASHYIGRAHKATRFDPENIDVFCAKCHHEWEDLKQYDYRDWKIEQLGKKKHDELVARARASLGEKDAIYKCMQLLGVIK